MPRQELKEFTPSTLPDPRLYQDTQVILIDPATGVRDVLFSDGERFTSIVMRSQLRGWNDLPLSGSRALAAEATIKSTGYDQTAELQQAANDLYASMGGDATQSSRYNTGFAIKLMDGQEYAVSNLVMPPGMTLASVSGALTPFSDKPSDTSGAVPVSTGPVLRHISPNQPMIQNDTTRGIIRTTGVRFALNTILGLTMVCDRFASSRRGDADFVLWRSAFGLDFIGNNLFTSSGFGLKVVTCNALRVRDNYALYAPWFLYNLVDSIVAFNQVGGGNGFASDSVWMSGDPDFLQVTRLNLFQSNLFYNNNSNGNYGSQYAQQAGISSVSGEVVNLDRNVGGGGDQTTNWIGETPLCFTTTGTLPTASGGVTISETKTYWATVQANGTSIKLSKNRGDRGNGIFINFTGAGVGCKLRVGGNANLHLNAGSHSNMFMPFRSDQAFGDAILLNGAPDNVFQALLVAYARSGNAGGAGYAMPVAGPAITLKNGSVRNQFKSGVIDGVQHTDVGVGPSAQKFGFSVDASSRPGFDALGMRLVNHTAANSESGAAAYEQADLNPRRIVLAPSAFQQISGTATLNTSLVRRATLNFAAASSAGTDVLIPSDWVSLRARIRWANNGTATASTQWGVNVGYFVENDDASIVEQVAVAGSAFTPAGGVGDQYKLHETVIELGATDNLIGKQCVLRVLRLDAAGPTLQVLQVVLEEAV
ncbi:MAG: hypothetical protein IIZ92_25845 [Aquincola sp.]|nr:hypothetical protein [Aquincola sp.]